MSNGIEKQTLVREGNGGIILPQYSAVFDRTQEYPVVDTMTWLHQLLIANRPITQPLNILEGQRLYVPTAQTVPFVYIQHMTDRESRSVYEATTAPKQLASSLLLLLRIGMGSRSTVVAGRDEVVHNGDLRKQSRARRAVQPAVIGLLQELGYGSPEEFADVALPYSRYLKEHNLEKWKPPKGWNRMGAEVTRTSAKEIRLHAS